MQTKNKLRKQDLVKLLSKSNMVELERYHALNPGFYFRVYVSSQYLGYKNVLVGTVIGNHDRFYEYAGHPLQFNKTSICTTADEVLGMAQYFIETELGFEITGRGYYETLAGNQKRLANRKKRA